MLRTIPVPLPWRSMFHSPGPADDEPGRVRIREKATAHVAAVLEPWRGTPYAPGSQLPGPDGGARCTSFVAAVLDGLRGVQTALEDVPLDLSFHAPEAAKAALRRFLRRYEPHVDVLRWGWLEPGDVVICGPRGGGPGHAMIVGPQQNTLWHCLQPLGVHVTGWGLVAEHLEFHGAYRLARRGWWGCA